MRLRDLWRLVRLAKIEKRGVYLQRGQGIRLAVGIYSRNGYDIRAAYQPFPTDMQGTDQTIFTFLVLATSTFRRMRRRFKLLEEEWKRLRPIITARGFR